MKRSDLTVMMSVENEYGIRLRVVSVDHWKKSTAWSRDQSVGVALKGHQIRTMQAVRADSHAAGVLVIAEHHLTPNALAELAPDAVLWAALKQPRQLFPIGTYASKRDAENAADAEVEATKAALRERREREDASLLDSARAHWGTETLEILLHMSGVRSHPDDGVWSDADRRVVTAIVHCGQRR